MNPVNRLAHTLGEGLVAGVVGTAAMTVSSTLEARVRHRPPSTAPARATEKLLGIAAWEDDRARARWGDLTHWGFGTSWGVVRSALGATRLSPAAATAVHGVAVWGNAQVMLPALDVAPPSVFWGVREVAIDAFHHAVYAAATGLAYEAIRRGRSNGAT